MKRLLLIAPSFYGYGYNIKNHLQNKGFVVSYVDEVPGGDFFYISKRFGGSLPQMLMSNYEKRILNIVKKKNIDTVFVIRGFLLPESLFITLRNENLSIISYQWDSVRNNPNALMIKKYSDISYSFDPCDSKEYGFLHLPLFYDWQDEDIRIGTPLKSDILFFGSWSYERFKIFEQIENICKQHNLKLKYFLYMPLQSYIRRIFHKEKLPLKLISFWKCSRKTYLRMVLGTSVVFDVPSPTQSGATMRTIEALSLRKKLLTTNSEIVKEKFYCDDNIMLFPAKQDKVYNFLQTPFNEDYQQYLYSIDEWLAKLGF